MRCPIQSAVEVAVYYHESLEITGGTAGLHSLTTLIAQINRNSRHSDSAGRGSVAFWIAELVLNFRPRVRA
jgi:hypothetical protein